MTIFEFMSPKFGTKSYEIPNEIKQAPNEFSLKNRLKSALFIVKCTVILFLICSLFVV